MMPKVTYLGPVPTAASVPKTSISAFNPAKVSVTKIRAKDVYRGSISMYVGWKVLERNMRPDGRLDLVVTHGSKVAEIKGVRLSSISNEL